MQDNGERKNPTAILTAKPPQLDANLSVLGILNSFPSTHFTLSALWQVAQELDGSLVEHIRRIHFRLAQSAAAALDKLSGTARIGRFRSHTYRRAARGPGSDRYGGATRKCPHHPTFLALVAADIWVVDRRRRRDRLFVLLRWARPLDCQRSGPEPRGCGGSCSRARSSREKVRIAGAINLLRQNVADRVLLSRSEESYWGQSIRPLRVPISSEPHGNELASRVDFCELGGGVDSTAQEAQALRPCIVEHHWHSIAIVTSNYIRAGQESSGEGEQA